MSASASNALRSSRIAVIGGGISGLAAALRLSELLPAAELTVFEATDRLGGVLDTATVGGFLIERSADNFLVKPPAAVELCRRLGMEDELLSTDESRRRALVVRDGRLVPIPGDFYLMSPRKLWPLLTSPMLSVFGKLRLLAEPLILPGAPSSMGRGPSEASDESVASFVRRRLGREVFDRLVQPLVSGIYTADPEQLSMAATMPEFLNYERQRGSLLIATLRSRKTKSGGDPANLENTVADGEAASGPRYGLFTAPKNGMASLVAAIAARLPAGSIRLGTRVTGLERLTSGKWQINSGTQLSALSSQPEFDAVIVALPAHAAAKLLAPCDVALCAELGAIPYAGCVVVSLGFARRQISQSLDAFGFVVPQSEKRPIIAASFASLKYSGRAPADHVLVRVFMGGALQPELIERTDSELLQIAREQLAELLGIGGEPLVSDVARWPNSMPQYHVGHLQRVHRIERLAARWPGLALAGNAYHGVGIPQCIRSGQAAAEQIAASVRA